jgi:DNA-binding transcriptional LysR family regulator
MAGLSLRQIEVFYATMRFGTVTAAAAALSSSQPTITREIRRLEDTIGVPLFDRRRQRLQPTAAARTLFASVKDCLTGLDAVNRCVADLRGASDTLVVASLPAIALTLLPDGVRRLSCSMPQQRIRIDCCDPREQSPITGFNFDLGLTEGEFFQPNADVVRIGALEQVCVVPVSHQLAGKRLLQPEDFEGVELLSLGENDPYRRATEEVFERSGVSPSRRIAAQSAHALCEMAAAGLGVAIVNPLTALAFCERGVVLRRLSEPTAFIVTAVQPAERPQAEAAGRLIAHLQAVFTEQSSHLERLLIKA